MELCSFTGQSGHSVDAGMKMYQALDSLAYCLPQSALNPAVVLLEFCNWFFFVNSFIASICYCMPRLTNNSLSGLAGTGFSLSLQAMHCYQFLLRRNRHQLRRLAQFLYSQHRLHRARGFRFLKTRPILGPLAMSPLPRL